jgi:hypothetical protein
MASDGLMEMMRQLLTTAPLLVVLVIGLSVAVARQRKHPRVSLFAAIGLGAALVQLAFGAWFQYWVRATTADGRSYSDLQVWFVGSAVLHTALMLLAWGFMIAAVFADRAPTPDRPR